MPTPIESRNLTICQRYLEGGETAEAIALDCGLSVMAVRVVVREGGALRKGKPRVKKTPAEKVVTLTHSRIGTNLAFHRTFVRGIDRRMAAEELGWSMQRLASAEQGTYNLTLLDLQDVARFMKIELGTLLTYEPTGKGQIILEHESGAGKDTFVVSLPAPESQPVLTLVTSVERDVKERKGNQDYQKVFK